MLDIELEAAAGTIRAGLDGVEKVTADWKLIGLLSAGSEMTECLIVDPSVPLDETVVAVAYSCGSTARMQLNQLDSAKLVRADPNKRLS